jgi:uncharacterized protein YndB with AHSA1/START domain
MAVRHQYIDRGRDVVWETLADPWRYSQWVVGTSSSRPGEGAWPEPGSSLAYTVPLGPRELHGHTVVRRCEPPGALELEAHTGLGTARIAFDIRPWGEGTLVIADEHPLRGLAGAAHNGLLDWLLQLRHRTMLQRLADVVETSSRERVQRT